MLTAFSLSYQRSEWTKLAKVVGDPNIFQALCQVCLSNDFEVQ